MQRSAQKSSIDMDYTEILSDITIDNFQFRATWSPIASNSCILWFREYPKSENFEALGQFSRFDKRNLLFFVARYVTSQALREKIDRRRFERKMEGLSPVFFREIERMCMRDKEKAYRHLFNLDDQMHNLSLSARRKIMARRFHPDAGGDHAIMSLINEAHDFLTETVSV